MKIGFFGDIMMGVCSSTRLPRNELLPAYIKQGRYDISAFNDIVSDSDINVANLESPISSKVEYSQGKKILVSPLEGLNLLKSLKINLVSLANNHSFDYGVETLSKTKRLLKERGISPIHSPQFNDMTYNAMVDGKPVSVIAYGAKPYYNVETDSMDPDYYKNWGFFSNQVRDMTSDTEIDYLSKNSLLPLIKEVAVQRSKADYLIVFIHWGFANTHIPSPLQILIAHKLIDSGVDVIIGHHPHVIQPVESYNGKLIAYSLGNFLFDSWRIEKKRSLVIRLETNQEEVAVDYYISNRDAQYRFTVNKAKMKFRRIAFSDQSLQWHYPDFLEASLNGADKTLSSYYSYSRYRNSQRNVSKLDDLKSIFRSDYDPYSKLNVLFSNIKWW